MNFVKSCLINLFLIFFLNSCGLYKKVDSNVPVQGEERAKLNIKEGRGMSLKNLAGNRSTNYEFSSSTPLWRATLEILDFLPLSTVDYSGGIIVTDWYNDNLSDNNDIKITVRFLSTEINASNIKVIVHKRNCKSLNNCRIEEINSRIKSELLEGILKKAALLDKEKKNN